MKNEARQSTDSGRVVALQKAVEDIEKEFGQGAISRLGDRSCLEVRAISTGSLGLDLALGCRGYPRGRVVEIFGPEGSGKTTLALHAIAETQAVGGVAAFIDAEHALDTRYAEALGINLDDLLIAQPDCGEQALQITERLASSGGVDLIVVDSVAALVPQAELDGSMADQQVGLQARMMAKALRKLTAALSRTQSCLLFINQVRRKIGVTFGSNETTPGGLALRFFSSIRLDIRRIGQVKRGEEICGNRTRVRVIKNKLAPPYRRVEFDIVYGAGISPGGELLDLAEAKGLIRKSGSWISFGDERLGQGRERARARLESDPALAEQLRTLVLGADSLAGDPAEA